MDLLYICMYVFVCVYECMHVTFKHIKNMLKRIPAMEYTCFSLFFQTYIDECSRRRVATAPAHDAEFPWHKHASVSWTPCDEMGRRHSECQPRLNECWLGECISWLPTVIIIIIIADSKYTWNFLPRTGPKGLEFEIQGEKSRSLFCYRGNNK